MSNEEVARKLEEFQEYLSISNIFTDIVRWIGWMFVEGLAWIVDMLENVTDEILLVKSFFNNPEIVAFVDSIKPFLYILLAFSLLYTGYLLIFQKKFNREGIAINLFIALIVILALNTGMDKADEFTDAAIDAVKVDSLYPTNDSSLSGSIIHRNIVDLSEIDKNNWSSTELEVPNSIPPSKIANINVREKYGKDTEDISSEGKEISKYTLSFNNAGEYRAEKLDQSGLEWNGKTGCSVCKTGRRISKQSATLFFYLQKIFEDTILEYPLKGSRMSLDIYIPSQQVAIEYDGGVFHRDTIRDIRKDRWLLEKMPNVTLIRMREPECGNYSSINEKVLKYHLVDQKTETFARCIEQVFLDIFQCDQPIDLDKDNTDILKLMDRTEVEKSLGELFPALAEEWDAEKNNGLTPFQFRAASHEQVYWICKKEHSWKASIASRSNGRNNCPFCGSRKISSENNLAVKFPNVIKEWHPTKNKKKPNEFFPASHFSVWWLCSHCQHEWKSRIYNLTLNKSKCPKCLK